MQMSELARTSLRMADEEALRYREQRIKTIRVVAGAAHSVADAKLLLEILGLDPAEALAADAQERLLDECDAVTG